MKKPHGKYPFPILLILPLLYSEKIWRNLQENRERGWKESWYSSLSSGVAVARTQVVTHADEAANAYQIFIRPGEAVQLVKDDEIERPGAHLQSSPPLSTTGAVTSARPNSSSPTHLHLLSMEPWGHFVSEAIIIKRHNSTYKYLASFTAYEADSAQSMRGMSTCECACVRACMEPRDHAGYLSPSVASGRQQGENLSPSTAMATACKSPWASWTPQWAFIVGAWLLMKPGECQSKMEAGMHALTHGYHVPQRGSIWIQ